MNGQKLALKYKDGEKTLLVTPQTVVVSYASGDAIEVKAGTGIFIAAASIRTAACRRRASPTAAAG